MIPTFLLHVNVIIRWKKNVLVSSQCILSQFFVNGELNGIYFLFRPPPPRPRAYVIFYNI